MTISNCPPDARCAVPVAGSFAFGLISDGHDEIKAILENPPENFRLLGLVERERMNELYNLTDLMLLPSFEELFP